MTAAASKVALGIDVGGTKTAAGLVQFPSGRPLIEKTIPTTFEQGGEAMLVSLVSLCEELLHRSSTPAPVLAVGVGLCELISPKGDFLSHHCLPWEKEMLTERLARFGPVVLDADVRAAARAEAQFGAGRVFRSFVYITVGTGIASCLVQDGIPHLGARGAAGTLASSPLPFTCAACGKKNDLSLEQIASGPAWIARFNSQTSGNASTGQEILAAAHSGHPAALSIIRSSIAALGGAIGWLINVLDPEAIVIGGGVGLALNESPLWEELTESVRNSIWSETQRELPILPAGTGRAAGIIGAAASAWVHSPSFPPIRE